LLSSFRNNDFPGDEYALIGFRVTSIAVPEPSTVVLLCIGALGVAALRRRHGTR